ncbi:hypothetical protein BBP00_00005514 [Phytophthora kernoviae]|uniref:Necrosis inducing-like protein NPP1 type n=2 Tax=Phytophthora kernoviae TaxID=325452 RepID=A0A3F2RNN0_9STRA|nr:hypothetical protein BBP00_00005514 [Phytophthora kernoviae]
MNPLTLAVALVVTLSSAQADIINHDQVQPFPQSAATSLTNTAALKFKPQIWINNGCHPYPAVNTNGDTSGGLKTRGSSSAGCRGSGYGSQVYGRSTWYNGVWAIMYSWYFPKDEPQDFTGHRHDWEHVVVWIDNPQNVNPRILAMTPSAHSGYSTYAPPDADMVDGTSVKVEYTSSWLFIDHHLEGTSTAGEMQDLIMWSDMTDAARNSLNTVSFGKANVPMNDGNFQSKLGKAYPWATYDVVPGRFAAQLHTTMHLVALAVIAAASLASTQASTIDHDQVQPFPQSAATSLTNTAALKYKPQIFINNGCHPYPAVNANGDTSGGLKTHGSGSAGCRGSGYGSQVYGRSTWYNGVWAIMYSWYFPKDSPVSGMGHRHDWEHVIVWIDNPENVNGTILAMTPSAHSGYSTYTPPPADMIDGASVKVEYTSTYLVINHHLEGTSTAGETQDLIMWGDMTDAARYALNTTDFGNANVPMKDGNFLPKLEKAYPWQ